jgi:HemX protein
MNETLVILVLRILLPCIYAGAAWIYFKLFKAENEGRLYRVAHAVLILALLLHTAFLFLVADHFQRCPLMTVGEGIMFGCWMLGIMHLLSEKAARTGSLGVFLTVPVAIGVTLGAVLLDWKPIPEEYRNTAFVLHIVGAFVALVCYSLAAVLAVMYLLLFTRLKKKQFDTTFRKLPPLDRLEKLCASWSVTGSALLAVSYLLGIQWFRTMEVNPFHVSEHILMFAGMLVYVGAGAARFTVGFSGKWFVRCVLAGFVLVLLHLVLAHGLGIFHEV